MNSLAFHKRHRTKQAADQHRLFSSEQKQLENELIHDQRVETVGMLAGGIAHDFNNVLAGILGNLFLMRNELKDRPEVTDRIKTIENQAHRAAEMIRRMLTFARKGEIDRQPFDLGPFARELVKFIEPAVPENIQLDFDISNEPMMMNGDPGQIQQCILNLISNARHAIEEKFGRMEDGEEGHIKLFVRYGYPAKNDNGEYLMDPDQSPPLQCVEMRVEDNGCGMSEKIRSHIFEPYFTTRGAGEGTGLGLPMVFDCVRIHQGCVRVESEPGRGSAFSINFPCLAGQGYVTTDDEDKTLIQGNGEHILIADDSELLRDTLRDMLTKAGYHVLTAEDGEEAVRVFREFRRWIRLAFVDVVMPRRNGKAVARRIKAMHPDAEVVLMTGYDLSETHLLTRHGLMQVMRKPWVLKDINRALRTIRVSDTSMRAKTAYMTGSHPCHHVVTV